MWEWLVKGIVAGIVTPLLSWWATYRQGERAQQVRDLEGTLAKEHAVDDAVDAVKNEPDRDFVLGADGRVHRVHGQRPPPAVHRGTEPDPQ